LDESIVAGKGVQDLANTFAAQASNYWRMDLGLSCTINRKKPHVFGKLTFKTPPIV
jgi:hypothetical protein